MKRWFIGIVVASSLVVTGCAESSEAIDGGTAERLQESVLAVSTAAHGDDLTAALAGLDEVEGELEAAKAQGDVTEDRYLRVLSAIDAVRDYLTVKISTANPAPTEEAEAPEVAAVPPKSTATTEPQAPVETVAPEDDGEADDVEDEVDGDEDDADEGSGDEGADEEVPAPSPTPSATPTLQTPKPTKTATPTPAATTTPAP